MTRKRTIAALFLGLLGLVATGSLVLAKQVPLGPPQVGVPPGTADDTVATASIRGYVVRVGGGPLSKAQVMLRPVEGRRSSFGAVTDASGVFTLANIQPGSYRLEVERDGYVDREYGQVSPSRPGTVLVLADGQEVRDVVINMVPTGTIAGRVYDEDGEPIVGASVRAMRYDYSDGEKVLNPVKQAQTNDLGEYRLYWLTPGEYQVAATFEARFRASFALRDAVRAADPNLLGLVQERLGDLVGGRGGALLEDLLDQADDPLDEIYVDTYYPGTNDPMAASPIQVSAGSEVRAVDFTVLPTRAVTVSGQVVGPYSPDDGFVSTVDIVPQNSVLRTGGNRGRGGGRGFRGGGNRDGNFELTGIAPGAYTLVATVRAGGRGGGGRGGGGRGGGGGQSQMVGFIDVFVGGEDIDSLVVPVQPGVPIAGRIFVDQTATEINVSRLRVRFEPTRSLPLGAPNARVGEDGTFLLENVGQTDYRVSLTGLPEDAYVAEGRSGATDVLSSGITVHPDVSPLEFSISGAGSRIDGTVQVESNTAFTGAQVVLVPADSARDDLYEVASADQYGRFSMRGIAPGRYRIFAWEDAPSGAYQDPDFVIQYDDYGEPVEIERGGLVTVQPRLIPAEQ